jgi:hypothetical protein
VSRRIKRTKTKVGGKMSDIKLFIKYFINSSIPRKENIKNLFHNAIFYMFIALIVIFFITASDLLISIKYILIGILILFIVILQLYLWYKTGEHRHWYRQQLGIPSKAEIKALKTNNGNQI